MLFSNNIRIVIIFILIFFSCSITTKRQNIPQITLIEKRNKYIRNSFKKVENHFIIFHSLNRRTIYISKSDYFIEHNSDYDDILFLIPLYNIIIKSKLIIICDFILNNNEKIKILDRVRNYTIINNCIYFDIIFLKYLHIHTNIFRFCKFSSIYRILQRKEIYYTNYSICKNIHYSHNYSIVTTAYRRNNFIIQMKYFQNQSIPPKHVIVVHDRNIVSVPYYQYNIIYIHTINFAAGFYFRYLISLLSPENDVIIYDDDWIPFNQSAHSNWLDKIVESENTFFGHHAGYKNGIIWCATPLLIHRKWIYLAWYNRIFETKTYEDGHLSFSILLLCNITCKRIRINGLLYKRDNLSSSKVNVSKNLWNDCTNDVKKKMKSTYIQNIKHIYNIY